jgi:hypothetical protein
MSLSGRSRPGDRGTAKRAGPDRGHAADRPTVMAPDVTQERGTGTWHPGVDQPGRGSRHRGGPCAPSHGTAVTAATSDRSRHRRAPTGTVWTVPNGCAPTVGRRYWWIRPNRRHGDRDTRHSCGLESGVTGSHSPELAGSMPLLPDGWCGHDPPVTSRDGNQPVVFLFRPVTSIGVAHSGERAPARRTCSAPTRAYPPSCGGSPVVGW